MSERGKDLRLTSFGRLASMNYGTPAYKGCKYLLGTFQCTYRGSLGTFGNHVLYVLQPNHVDFSNLPLRLLLHYSPSHLIVAVEVTKDT